MRELFLVLGFLCQTFAAIDFAGMFLGYDLTGVPWSPLVAGGIGWLFYQLAKVSGPKQSPPNSRHGLD